MAVSITDAALLEEKGNAILNYGVQVAVLNYGVCVIVVLSLRFW